MARPRKDTEHRLPRWHSKSGRWRLTINHAHGAKDFWWKAETETPTPPPHIIAAAVAIQDQWHAMVNDWKSHRTTLEIAEPDKDWSLPVYITADQIAAAEEKVKEIYAADRRESEAASPIGLNTG